MAQEIVRGNRGEDFNRKEFEKIGLSIIDTIAFSPGISIPEITSLSGIPSDQIKMALHEPVINTQLITSDLTNNDQQILYRLKRLSEMSFEEAEIARKSNVGITQRVVHSLEDVSMESLIQETPLESRYIVYDSLRRLYENGLLVAEASSKSDQTLLRYIDIGWQEKILPVFERTKGTLIHKCYTKVGDFQIAEDIVSHTWMQTYINRFTVDLDSSLQAWINTIASNRSIDYIRQNKAITTSEIEENSPYEELSFWDTVQNPEPSAEKRVGRTINIETLQGCIAKLPPKFRNIVYLRYTEDLSFREIAQRLHIPLSTAKTYFQRARPLMIENLKQQEITQESYRNDFS